MHLLLIAEIPGPQGVRCACRISIISKYIHITIGPTTDMKEFCGDGEEDKIMGWFGTVYFADEQLIL